MPKAMKQTDGKTRCEWVAGGNALYYQYHDAEWGVPVYDDRRHFEMLILEGAQAGLSWATILNKREGYRAAFAGFEPNAVAAFTAADVRRLLQNPAIVRNRLKIQSAITNAQAFLRMQQTHGSFNRFAWDFVGGKPTANAPRSPADSPTTSTVSDALARDLKKRGFKFVGSTILYSYMEAVGIVNNHQADCYRRLPCQKAHRPTHTRK